MKRLTLAAAAAVLPTLALAAEPVPQVADAYARSANPAVAGAFMTIHNPGTTECVLTGATSDAAEKVELHTHKEEGGVMKMVAVEGGLAIPAGGDHALIRGGDHIMFMGLKQPVKDGDTLPVTLDFGACGTVPLSIPVDNQRQPAATGAMPMGMHMGHGAPAAPATPTAPAAN